MPETPAREAVIDMPTERPIPRTPMGDVDWKALQPDGAITFTFTWTQNFTLVAPVTKQDFIRLRDAAFKEIAEKWAKDFAKRLNEARMLDVESFRNAENGKP